MTLSIGDVRAWNSQSLLAGSNGLHGISRVIEGRCGSIAAEQNVLAESWHGDAAVAAAERVVAECSTLSALSDAFSSLAAEFSASASIVDFVRSNLVEVIDELADRGFEVADNGVVTADRAIASLDQIAGPLGEDAVLALQIRTQEATLSVLDALQQANHAALGVCDRVRGRIVDLQDSSSEVIVGHLALSEDGGFSWRPDIQAMAAGVTIGTLSDATGHALKTAAAASSDDLALGLGRRLGPMGAALGTIPAISNDIEGGMDPTKAIVTEGAGAVTGVVVGGVLGQIAAAGIAGSAVGSVIPGAGTAAGLVVGVAMGAALAYGVPKFGQWIWE